MARVLKDVLTSARSKNAGPFSVSFDLFFPDLATFELVRDANVLDPEVIGPMYNLPAEKVKVHHFQPALAVKISVPRATPGGSPDDTDVAGGQQFAPLLDLPLPA
jgi:hypothetical protein